MCLNLLGDHIHDLFRTLHGQHGHVINLGLLTKQLRDAAADDHEKRLEGPWASLFSKATYSPAFEKPKPSAQLRYAKEYRGLEQ